MFKTRMTELFGIEYPIQCGTMQALSRAELVAAVANAGALACLPAATFPTRQELLDEIKKTRDMTDKPFGVNVSLFPALMPSPPEEMIQTVIDSGVKILETAGRNPEPYRQQIAEAGLVHFHKCARVRDAAKVARLGLAAVSIVGTECGGHPSMEKVTTLILIPKAADQVDIPLIAGGGFCDGRSLVAALALGADGVNMGTRFIATQECPAHPAFKERIIKSQEAETVLVMESLMNPARVLKTPWSEKIIEMERQGATLEELMPMISGQVSRKGWSEGNLNEGMYPAGQVIGRIEDIPTVADLIKRTMAEAMEARARLDKMA
ncbi:MAG: nitronate monooxygenase [Deltaproteobacteria bacterium]|nr:nitronate monooxygenase [Deltaproteobacteria bacterium]